MTLSSHAKLVALSVAAALVFSCRKEAPIEPDFTTDAELTVEEARSYYDLTHAGLDMPVVVAPGPQTKAAAVPPPQIRWDWATTDRIGTYSIVEVPIFGGANNALMQTEELDGPAPETGNIRYNVFNKLLVKKNETTGEKRVYIVTVIADDNYLDLNDGNIYNFKYLRHPGFTGRIYLSNTLGETLSGVYSGDGRAYRRLSIGGDEGAEAQGGPATKGLTYQSCLAYRVYESSQYCVVTIILEKDGTFVRSNGENCSPMELTYLYTEYIGCEEIDHLPNFDDPYDPFYGFTDEGGGNVEDFLSHEDSIKLVAPRSRALFSGNETRLSMNQWILLERLMYLMTRFEHGNKLYDKILNLGISARSDITIKAFGQYDREHNIVIFKTLDEDLKNQLTLFHELFHAFQCRYYMETNFNNFKLNMEVEAYVATYLFAENNGIIITGDPIYDLVRELTFYAAADYGPREEVEYRRIYHEISEAIKNSSEEYKNYNYSNNHEYLPYIKDIYGYTPNEH